MNMLNHTMCFCFRYMLYWFRLYLPTVIRSVPNYAVELSRGYSLVMKSFRSMHERNKFYYKGASECRIVVSVAEITV